MCPGLLCATCVRDLIYQRHHARHAKATWPVKLLFPSTNSQKKQRKPCPTSTLVLPYRNANHMLQKFSAEATIAAVQNCMSNWFILLYLYTSISSKGQINHCEPENFSDPGLDPCICW